MPRLAIYEARTRGLTGRGALNVRASGEDFGAQIGRALQGVGQDVQSAGRNINRAFKIVDDRNKKREQVIATRDLQRKQLEWVQNLEDRKRDPEFAKKYGEDGRDFAAIFKQDYEDYAETTLSGVKASQRDFYTDNLLRTGISLVGDAFKHQAHVAATFTKTSMESAIQDSATAVSTNPETHDAVLANLKASIAEAPYLTEDVRIQLNDLAVDQVNVASVIGAVEQDPHGTLAALKNGVYDDRLNASQKKVLISSADSKISQMEQKFLQFKRQQRESALRTNMGQIAEGEVLDISQLLTNPDLTLSDVNALLKASTLKQNVAGNNRLTNEQYSEILTSANTENPVSAWEVLQLMDPSVTPNPINRQQMTALMKVVSSQTDASVEKFIEAFKPGIVNVPLRYQYVDTESDKRLFLFQSEITALAQQAEQPGTPFEDVTVFDMLDPNSKVFDQYGGALIRKYTPTQSDLDAMQQRVLSQNFQTPPEEQIEESPEFKPEGISVTVPLPDKFLTGHPEARRQGETISDYNLRQEEVRRQRRVQDNVSGGEGLLTPAELDDINAVIKRNK